MTTNNIAHSELAESSIGPSSALPRDAASALPPGNEGPPSYVRCHFDRGRWSLHLGDATGLPLRGLDKLADKMCRHVLVAPKRRKRRGWSFGIPGEPNGRFIVRPLTRSTAKPSVYPVLEPRGFFLAATISRVLEGRLTAVRLAACTDGIDGQIGRMPSVSTFDFDLELAIARTLSAINDDVRLVSRTNRSNCCFCDRRLRDDASKDAGYGPVCAKRYQVPHGTKDRALPTNG